MEMTEMKSSRATSSRLASSPRLQPRCHGSARISPVDLEPSSLTNTARCTCRVSFVPLCATHLAANHSQAGLT